MGHGRIGCAKWITPRGIGMAAGLAMLSVQGLQFTALGQQAGHAAPAVRSTAPTRAVGIAGRPGTSPMRSGQASRPPVRANTLGANSSTPRPAWGIPSHNRVRPNYPQGNRRPRRRVGYGAGYVGGFYGVPYYTDPATFFGGNGFFGSDGDDDDTAQGPPQGEGRPDYAPGEPDGQPYPDQPYPGQPNPGQSYAGPPNEDQGYPPPPRAPYAPEAREVARDNIPQTDGLDHPEVTLVFNDGRPPKKVHSYVLTGSSVFVVENGHQSQIPLAELDLPATIAKNQEAGIDFQVPGGSR